MIHRNQYLKEIGAEYHPINQTIELPDDQLVTEEEFRRWGAENEKDRRTASLIEFLEIKQKKKEKTADLF